MFKVKITEAKPEGVRLSKKKTCVVTITPQAEANASEEYAERLLEYFLEQQDPTWASQFKTAVKLGPQIDEEDMIVVKVDLV